MVERTTPAPRKHLTILATLYIGFGFVFAAIGVLGFVGLLPITMMLDKLLSALVFPGGHYAPGKSLESFRRDDIWFGCFLILVSLTGIIGGLGLREHRNWARILIMILGMIHSIAFPVGTVLGFYTIWVLCRHETIRLFRHSESA